MTSEQLSIHQYAQREQESLDRALACFSEKDHEQLLNLYKTGWQNIKEHGDFARWSQAFSALPHVDVGDVDFKSQVQISAASSANVDKDALTCALQGFHPWRKGPFDILGVHIDTEWRSDWKWERVLPHISSLENKMVLDIGCGSGYHMWRMHGEGAKLVLGVDTSSLFPFHFAAVKRYQLEALNYIIPAGIDDVPSNIQSFDTVFSMGVLYHRKSPLEHLYKIKGLLREGGEMVLETLVVDGDETTCLMPHGRYAKMRNVWFIPSVLMLEVWLKRVGFKHVRCVDLSTTSIEEQRTTDWMRFESLKDFLDPNDSSLSIEGYPAPKRAVLVANT